MAGIAPSVEFKMFDHLVELDGWTVYDMTEFETKIYGVVDWCKTTLGPMLVIYDIDRHHCRWHAAMLEVPNSGDLSTLKCLFAFKDPADYTMLRLRWA